MTTSARWIAAHLAYRGGQAAPLLQPVEAALDYARHRPRHPLERGNSGMIRAHAASVDSPRRIIRPSSNPAYPVSSKGLGPAGVSGPTWPVRYRRLIIFRRLG
ncbi:hypothetical protein [Streptomyces xanthophaeus]|uniref:hypothetical protein n=1 Tax=Streptomyces xanthophaeus TaxID=67385 RepID=UPI00233EF21B|nr:hypothetical protein [Streptomyces xanthophaeus]